jgi:hypothetical protein
MSKLDTVRAVPAPIVATLLLAATAALTAQGDGPTAVYTFDGDAAGQPPARFTLNEGRDAGPGRWSIAREGSTQVLVHTGDPASGRAPATAIVPGTSTPPLLHGEISVRVRLLEGERSAGLVWRYRDARNYHLAQFTLGEEQAIALYRVVDGNRVRLENEDDLELDPAAWHSLRVVLRNDEVRVYLGGIRVFEDRDRTAEPLGVVGLWCAGNTTAQFDDVRVTRQEDRD